ncbi:hypothetical protein Tco_1130650 [Tanacetum coccineum]
MFQDSDFDDLDDVVENVVEETVDAATTRVSTVSALVTTAGVAISTAEPRTPPTSTTVFDDDEDLTIAQTSVNMKSEKAKDKEKRVILRDAEDPPRLIRSITTLQPLPTIDPKDKGKSIMQESEPTPKNSREAQIQIDAEIDKRMFEEEQAQVERDQKIARERVAEQEAKC